jgi:hypothetical protein
VINRPTAARPSGQQFSFVHARTLELMQQDADPFSIGSRELGGALGKHHQIVSVERTILVDHRSFSSR